MDASGAWLKYDTQHTKPAALCFLHATSELCSSFDGHA